MMIATHWFLKNYISSSPYKSQMNSRWIKDLNVENILSFV